MAIIQSSSRNSNGSEIESRLSSPGLAKLRDAIRAIPKAVTRSQARAAERNFRQVAQQLSASDITKLIALVQHGDDEEDRWTSFIRSRLIWAMAIGKPTEDVIPALSNLALGRFGLTATFAVQALAAFLPSSATAKETLMDIAQWPYHEQGEVAFNAVRHAQLEDKETKKRLRLLASDYRPWLSWTPVYVAERWVLPSTRGRKFETMCEVVDWIEYVVGEKWFLQRYPAVRDIQLRDGRGSSDASCHDIGRESVVIRLPRWAREELVILHELAHAVSPMEEGHDELFCGNYLSLVKQYLGHDAWKDLKLNFETFLVPHRPPRGRRGGIERAEYLPSNGQDAECLRPATVYWSRYI